MDLAPSQGEVDAVQHLDAAKGLADPSRRQDDGRIGGGRRGLGGGHPA